MKPFRSLILVPSLVLALACATAPTVGDSETQTPDADAGLPPPTAPADAATANDAATGPKLGAELTVSPPCQVSGRYGEWAKGGYEGALYAIKVTPPSYPFRAEAISYDLDDGQNISAEGTVYCNDKVPHKVGFLKAPADNLAPDTSPADVQLWAATGSGGKRSEALPKPVVLEKGEAGYILIQMVNTGSAAVCVYSCSTLATPGAHHRTKQLAAPFAWSSYQPSGNVLASLQGHVVLP